MTIYAKTNAGRLLAFSNTQELPADLRELLRRVDGKTRERDLLSRSGDAELLSELVAQGLVGIVSGSWRTSNYATSPPDADVPTRPQFDATLPATLDDMTMPAALDDMAMPTPQAYESLPAEPGEATVPAPLGYRLWAASERIESAKKMMLDFLALHMPQHVESTRDEIDGLTSKTDLLRMLTDYIDLVQPTGKPGQQHVQQLLLVATSTH